METELLQQILSELKNIKTDVSELKQGQTRLEIILENEIKPSIKVIAEGHEALNEKLDDLKDLNEKVISIQTETAVHKTAIKELFKRTAE